MSDAPSIETPSAPVDKDVEMKDAPPVGKCLERAVAVDGMRSNNMVENGSEKPVEESAKASKDDTDAPADGTNPVSHYYDHLTDFSL
jgi:hypothetical protein